MHTLAQTAVEHWEAQGPAPSTGRQALWGHGQLEGCTLLLLHLIKHERGASVD